MRKRVLFTNGLGKLSSSAHERKGHCNSTDQAGSYGPITWSYLRYRRCGMLPIEAE